ncbi:hypothetical protein A7K91_06380 [Paenibacillus oryzae]|uniref:SLH domain-containing protein n=1 Tax=Paenibacillus oryzae TaxID=1844972 RepID=A0A1A5YDA7_9BACL|nr:S-layer homology domain-containing protein [Paenibacillus oryzae]OBR63574.1 hypothetical protein A7K91_06380 [Paenibacillus oryzae]
MKRALALFLTIALIVTLTPIYGVSKKVEAAGSYFLFPNENATRENARIVSTQNIELTGTINGVVGSSISYNIKQVTPTGTERELNTTEEITTGILTTGDNRVTVSSVILFPGMNKITFKGVAGSSTVSESIYIEYRDSPMLYDLKVQFENQEYDFLEDQPTMLYSSATTVQSTGTIVITGRAPNATKVNITINGRSYDFNVASTAANTFRFSTSQLTIDKGINNVIFKVHNGGQVVETTRQIAFYNGEVTYYDMKLSDGTKTSALENNMEFSTAATGTLSITGKAIVPLPLYDSAGAVIDSTSDTDVMAKLQSGLKAEIQGITTMLSPKSGSISYLPKPLLATTKFMTVSFAYDLPASGLNYDVKQSVRFIAPNLNGENTSAWTGFTLRDSNRAYIYDVNYLTGFDGSMTSAISTANRSQSINDTRILNLQGTDIPASGVDVYSVPMGVEVLVANYDKLNANLADLVTVGLGGPATGLTYKMVMKSATGESTEALSQIVTQQVNGETIMLKRVFFEIQKLPRSGTNTLLFKLAASTNASTAAVTVIARLLYGPYVKYDSIVNGGDVRHDSASGSTTALLAQLSNFRGQLFNITNTDDIEYKSVGTKKQSVFMYINNVEVPLVQDGTATITKFIPEAIASNDTDKIDALINILNKAGENTIKFVFLSANNNYESTMRFNIIPTNLPMVPAANTDGVYPYTTAAWPPVSTDPNFSGQNGVYTTKEARFDVFGTFDFIDLGNSLSQLNTTYGNISNKPDYKVTISNADWSTSVNWDLSKQMKVVNPDRSIVTNSSSSTGEHLVYGTTSAVTPDANVTFYYDYAKESFMFRIEGQEMPADGSTMVYVITVFNAGENGPRATYRLEVRPISIPYTIHAPVSEERVTNKNFVEVIISSPGADSITVGKDKAEKITFREYNGSADVNGTAIEAFRAVVKDLRANRDTKISFTITRGDDTIKQDMTVKYVPTNIPGAQMLATMASSHKMFNNALTLTFAKGTQLIRPGYNDSVNHATQVYNGNELLFAIANPNDGIVDRHMYEGQPANYSANSQAEGNLHIGYRFQDQARQFIKASPLFWIDGGLADDPSTASYDPITTGVDPFPFDNYDGKYIKSFTSRWNEFGLELKPSTAGSLTLTYDSNIVQSAGTTITVFRFDPFNSTWENIGGVVDEKKRTVTVPFTKFGYYVAGKLTRGFNDITDHPYAREAMEAIFSKGVMNAIDPTGLFGGDRYVTRGEFTRMIVRALELDLNYSGDLHFSYYPETMTNANNATALYDYRYIETAARAGIVNGKRPGFFDEDVELNRQEAATILARALQLKLETDSTKAKTQLDKAFKDSGSFDFYSVPPVLAIQKKGFIQGKAVNPNDPKEGFVFEPKARLLRSDAAIIMARVMNDMKKLPKIYN